MSLESVRTFFETHAPEIEILVTEASSATVMEAANAHGVEPAQIAKTLGLWLNNEPILLVMGGAARLDNQKYKARFGTKAKMLNAEEIVRETSHPVGGVCPFGLPKPIRVFADESLRSHEMVIPAAGATNAAVKITPHQMVDLAKAEWVDVAQSATD
jgi:prolyl-tRNA editing enzyme YbaK/EbsC (Cys-tRNA(Pro) deacylase)